jgi:hypothetical protein
LPQSLAAPVAFDAIDGLVSGWSSWPWAPFLSAF